MNRDEIWMTAAAVWKEDSSCLESLIHSIDRNSFIRCVETIMNCPGRIVTTGAGTSSVAAKKIAHTLACIERPAFFLSPADAVHGGLGAVKPDDVAIIISKGGGTAEIVNLIPPLKKKKVFILGVTGNEASTLARESDLLVKVKVEREADPFDLLATTSTIAVIAYFDAVCITLMHLTGYTKEQFALIHPGGAVGEKLQQAIKSG
ncbi:MAG: SIS domain-containing protein [Spirochaetota bacterium]